MYNVTFVMRNCTVTTTVESELTDEEQIIEAAQELVFQTDGIDASNAQDAEVENA